MKRYFMRVAENAVNRTFCTQGLIYRAHGIYENDRKARITGDQGGDHTIYIKSKAHWLEIPDHLVDEMGVAIQLWKNTTVKRSFDSFKDYATNKLRNLQIENSNLTPSNHEQWSKCPSSVISECEPSREIPDLSEFTKAMGFGGDIGFDAPEYQRDFAKHLCDSMALSWEDLAKENLTNWKHEIGLIHQNSQKELVRRLLLNGRSGKLGTANYDKFIKTHAESVLDVLGMKPTPKKEAPKMLKIEDVHSVIVNGVVVESLTDDQILNYIAEEGQRIESLKAITTPSCAINALRNKHQANINRLLGILDDRHHEQSKKDNPVSVINLITITDDANAEQIADIVAKALANPEKGEVVSSAEAAKDIGAN